MKVLDLFAGIGGFSLATHWMGWETVAFVERDPFCQKVLRKNFGQDIKIHDDITTFSGKPFRGRVDIVTGGFPCQPASIAGQRKGKDDDRYLFPQMLRVVDESKPAWVVAENVRGLLSVGNGELFEEVCSLLDGIGYTVQTFCIPASAVDAPHRRDRLWIVAHANSDGEAGKGRNGSRYHFKWNTPPEIQEWQDFKFGLEFTDRAAITNAQSPTITSSRPATRGGRSKHRRSSWRESWVDAATRLCSVDDGIPGGLVRPKRWRENAIKAIGNSIVPQIAFEIFKAIEDSEAPHLSP